MYVFDFCGLTAVNEYVELIKMFLRPSEFKLLSCADYTDEAVIWRVPQEFDPEHPDKNALKRNLYNFLADLGLKAPEWGILTGVRPVKLLGELSVAADSQGTRRDKEARLNRQNITAALKCLKDEYYLADSKLALLSEILELQKAAMPPPPESSIGLYVGIPFCPTRCEYCSFPSNQVQYDRIYDYLEALKKEIRFVASGMKRNGLFPETLYIGGGTPTTLNEKDLDDLLGMLTELFSAEQLAEFTVEAGRPDTIDAEKLKILKNRGVTRISINPQSLEDQTLALIGRDHDSESVRRAFMAAREVGISAINSDIIAGLPGERPEDFERTLRGVLEFSPENVTVHTLALKRAARLKEADTEYHYRQAETAAEMLKMAHGYLKESGYKAYYLYRQKQMAGNLENTGYAKEGYCCLYNMRIMEENQTIIALGAGASTKRYYPETNRLERVFNVSNYEIYVERIDEMLERKRSLLQWHMGKK
jgi:oxygen-independent coproporphyrinogen-3 oxidase